MKLFKLFSPTGKLEGKVPHPCDIQGSLFLTFDFVHILKTIRNNWLNQRSEGKLFSYPDLNCISIDHCTYPLNICHASFRDIRMLYNSEKDSLAKLAPRLTAKACYPSSLERQNVKLALKVVHESTIAALAIQNEQRSPAFKSNTSEFVAIMLSLWKIFNVNMPFKHVRLNDPMSKPLTFNDERFTFLTRIVYWLDAWQSMPEKGGKLSNQTFTSLKHACLVLPLITNFLTETCGYSYLLTSFLQTDPLEHHFGLYRMMSGSNYHVSYLQILESERRLKVSNILSMFSNQTISTTSLQEFIRSFSSLKDSDSIDEVDLDPFLMAISDVSAIECNIQVLQSLAFIAGYSAQQYLKRSQPCRVCRDILTLDRDLLFDEPTIISHFKLLELSDRGGLKYPSEIVLESIVTAWKILVCIENDSELMLMFVKGLSRKILVDLTIYIVLEADDCQSWIEKCSSCLVSGSHILQKLIFVAGNCFLANMVRNYNSMVISRVSEKRKLKKFN